MLYGDSHGAATALELAKVFAAKGAGLRQFTHSGCMPVPGVQSSVPGESCERFNTDAMHYLDPPGDRYGCPGVAVDDAPGGNAFRQ
jgi:hypothetical protein